MYGSMQAGMLSCVWLCDSMDCSPPGSSVNGILQARNLEWIAMPSSRGYSQPICTAKIFYFFRQTRQILLLILILFLFILQFIFFLDNHNNSKKKKGQFDFCFKFSINLFIFLILFHRPELVAQCWIFAIFCFSWSEWRKKLKLTKICNWTRIDDLNNLFR